MMLYCIINSSITYLPQQYQLPRKFTNTRRQIMLSEVEKKGIKEEVDNTHGRNDSQNI
jgi:hypothetical protein